MLLKVWNWLTHFHDWYCILGREVGYSTYRCKTCGVRREMYCGWKDGNIGSDIPPTPAQLKMWREVDRKFLEE